MKRLGRFLLVLTMFFAVNASSEDAEAEPKKHIVADIEIPFERPIGFSINIGALTSLTFEGRFIWGMARNFSLVISPSYQNTIQLPFYHFKRKELSAFDIKRLNLGAGIRGHFYEYDSRDGIYLEGLCRVGLTWAGADPSMWSIIPSLMVGYTSVYDSGYTVSFGVGLEWEALLGTPPGYHSEFLKTAYWGITKLPLMGEISLGWTW